MNLKKRLYKNALISERFAGFSREERQEMIVELLKNGKSERQLSRELGITHSTIHDWKTLRQETNTKKVAVSLSHIYRKLMDLDFKSVKDWGRIELIRDRCEDLLRRRKNV